MSRDVGQMRTCDRCGHSQFFKCTGTTELDGGFTKNNTFEKSEGWDCLGVWDLCPKCAEEWQKKRKQFMGDFIIEERRETKTVY